MEKVQPIDYKTCADSMLKMWMENVLTDGEYNKIMDKLNKAHDYHVRDLVIQNCVEMRQKR